MSNELDLHQIRAKAQEILERAKSDEEFRRQLQDDPTAVLPRYGLPERAVLDFIREAGKRVLCEETSTCFDYTCLVTVCPGSCIWHTCEADTVPITAMTCPLLQVQSV